MDRVREVRNLASVCGTNWLAFSWLPPAGADPHTNNLLAEYRLYLAGTNVPMVLDRFSVNYTATNLLVGHGYPVLITSVDNLGRESSGASLLSATLVPNPAQTVAHSFYGITRVAWEWVQPEAVIDRFLVYMAETNFTSVAGMTPAASMRGHSSDFYLVSGKTYYFAVTTRNIAGCDSTSMPLRVIAHTPGGTTAPTLLQPGAYADGVFTIVADGPLGAAYVLQGSTNLTDWIRLQTNTPSVLPFAVTVTNGPGVYWFYRVKVE